MEPLVTFLNLEYIYLKIYECVTGACRFSGNLDFIDSLRPFSIIISLFLIAGIIYAIIRIRQIRREEVGELSQVIVPKGMEEKKREKWNRLTDLALSENESDWRLAIIEADVMMDDMLEGMGYQGDGIGERLKQIDKNGFRTLDQAWEAHKVRNTIAHAGSDYTLTQREVRRVIDLYKQVFEEFDYI